MSDSRIPSPGLDPVKLDQTDRRIVAALQADGRRAFRSIAEELGLSEGAVRYRVRRLQDSDVLQVVGIADPLRLGFGMMALFGIRVRPGSTEAVCEALAELAETSYVALTTGAYDVFAEVVCRDAAHFTELLTARVHRIDGVVTAESFMVLQIHKMAYGWGVGEVETAPGPQAQSGFSRDRRARRGGS